jgi:hypothetical protein
MAERIIDGSGAGVGEPWRPDEIADGDGAGIKTRPDDWLDVPPMEGGGVVGVQVAGAVWCQFRTVGARYSAAGWVIPEVGASTDGGGGIV